MAKTFASREKHYTQKQGFIVQKHIANPFLISKRLIEKKIKTQSHEYRRT